MRIKKIFGVLGLCVALVGCGGGPGNGDVRSAYEKNIKIMEDFISAMEKAGNADQVVAAVNQYIREIEKLGPRMKALREKHPELAEMDESGGFPEELKDMEDKFAAMGMKMMRAMAKVMEYQSDPKVMDAQQRMTAAAQALMPDEAR